MEQEDKKFNPEKLERLNNPNRFKQIPPEIISSKIKIANPRVLIDLGAGTGLFSRAFSEIYPGCEIYACDISQIMVNWMKNNLNEYPLIYPVLTEENTIPLNNEIADIVIMINLYHELEDHLDTLKECQRILKKGGIIAISDWKKEKMVNGPSYEIRIDKTDVKVHLEATGFTKIEIFDNLEFNYLLIANNG